MACDIGVYGLAVMGVNVALNIASRGFKVCMGNRSPSRVDAALSMAEAQGLKDAVVGTKDIATFVKELKRPRRIIMLVQAGNPVESLIGGLLPLLEEGDLLVDGGNEFFENTERRMELCKSKGVLYMGLGISGGEEGARNGPSLMAGGTVEAWQLMEPFLVSIAAKIDPKASPEKFPSRAFTEQEKLNACVTHIGPGGAGNFVKMVHNGIEYGDMQVIAEVYSVLRHCYGMNNDKIADLFQEWNRSELESYLIEITSIILRKKDPSGPGYLVDKIADTAGSKGTAKWTVQQAAERGVAVPSITAALDMRYISSHRGLRERLSSLYAASIQSVKPVDGVTNPPSIADVKSALYLSKICCYAQGMHLIAVASRDQGWNLNLAEISRIWKGGCIIRARFLDVMMKVFKANPQTENILLDETIRAEVQAHLPGLRRVIDFAVCKHPVVHEDGSPLMLSLPTMSASYHYLAALTSCTLPTNIIQAQRDFFGAHTFERRDNPGVSIHESNWTQS